VCVCVCVCVCGVYACRTRESGEEAGGAGGGTSSLSRVHSSPAFSREIMLNSSIFQKKTTSSSSSSSASTPFLPSVLHDDSKLQNVLASPHGLKYFMLFVEGEKSSENLRFMRDNRKFVLKRQAEMKYLSSVAERVCNSLQANTKITASRTTSKAKTKESKANGGGHIASSSANISSSAIIGVRAAANESDLGERNANRNKHIEKIRLAVKRGDLTSLQLNALNIRHQIQDQLMSSLQVGRKDGDDEKCSGGARGGWDRQRRLISDHECKAALRSLKLQNLSSFPIIVVVHRVSMRTTRAARHEEQQQQSSTSFPKNSSTTLLKNCSCKVSLKGHNREDLIAAGQGGGSDMAALKHSSSQRTKPIKERTDLLEWNEPIRLTSARYQDHLIISIQSSGMVSHLRHGYCKFELARLKNNPIVHTQLETYKTKTRIQPTPYVMHLSVLVDPAILDQALDLRRGRSRSGVI